jgi:hypothetical protein
MYFIEELREIMAQLGFRTLKRDGGSQKSQQSHIIKQAV